MTQLPPALPRIEAARILVVEDEHLISRDIQLSLKSLGYSVCGTADTGLDAIEKAVALEPDAVLMDIRLRGDLDGIESARRLRARSPVPVVFLTAYADEGTLRRAEATAPFGYVLKPFDDRELHVALMMALCRHRAQVEAERTIAERTTELREALRVRDDFLAIAGHELRTPLAALLLQVQGLLRADTHDNPGRLKERLEKAARAGERLEKLVGELLDVSRISGGHLSLNPEPLTLGAVVKAVVERFADQAARVQSSISVELKANETGLWDRARLEQVVTNLVSNALKYGPGKPVEVVVSSSEGDAVLEIRDHGIGIEPGQQRRIFERFERAVEAREYGGLGLGLWIARQVVQASGGRLAVESAPGEGATFTVRLPLRPQESANALH